MKKFSKVLALSMALSLAFGVTAFAEESVTVDTAALDNAAIAEGVEIPGNPNGVNVKTAPLDSTEMEVLVTALNSKNVQDQIAAWVVAQDGSEVASLKVVKAFDTELWLHESKVDLNGSWIQLDFAWDGIIDGKKYAVLNMMKNGTVEVVCAEASGGYINVKLTDLSSIMIVEIGEKVQSEEGDNTDPGSVAVDSAVLDSAAIAEGVEIPDNPDGVSIKTAPLNVTETQALATALSSKNIQDQIIAWVAAQDGSEVVSLKVVKAFDAEPWLNESKVDLNGSWIQLSITWDGITDGKKYAVLHMMKNSFVEVVCAEVSGGYINVKLTDLSPIMIVEVGENVQSDEEDNTDPGTIPSGSIDNSSNSNQSSYENEAPKSPATGETLPMAEIMALICLAGVTICVGKVRYNKQ